jgi:UDP-GlcNAc:undecaprenyl-phosphate GlcNAc-1-phosphate transferase
MVLCLAVLGAAFGFLPFNRNPAKIFMGDAGSMLLGLNAAVLLLLFAKSNASRWMFASVMVFGLPLADMCLTLARRWRNQRPLMQGDRSHFYDQLVDRGMPVGRVVAISYALAVFFAIMGCAAIVFRTRYLLLLYAVVALAVVLAVGQFKMVRLESALRSADDSGTPSHPPERAGQQSK